MSHPGLLPTLGHPARLTGPLLTEASPLTPQYISAAHSDCSLAAVRATASLREGRAEPGRARDQHREGQTARALGGEFAAQVNRQARRRALSPRPPSDFQARNSASRALSPRSRPRRFRSPAAAAAALHTKDCSPPSSASTSTPPPVTASPTAGLGARRQRRCGGNLSLPQPRRWQRLFFFSFFLFIPSFFLKFASLPFCGSTPLSSPDKQLSYPPPPINK